MFAAVHVSSNLVEVATLRNELEGNNLSGFYYKLTGRALLENQLKRTTTEHHPLNPPHSRKPSSLDLRLLLRGWFEIKRSLTFHRDVLLTSAFLCRYRESFSKTTRGFRERLRARNGAMADLGARAREVSAGVVRVFERISLEPTDKHKDGGEARPGGSTESHIGNSSRQSALVQEVQGHGSLGGSASSTATTVFAGSVIAGSSRVAPQPIQDEANGSFSGSRRKVHFELRT